MTADLPSPHRPVHFLARSQPINSRWHASFRFVVGRPHFLFPGISVHNTFLGVCSSSLLIKCPHQFNLRSVIFLTACITLVVPRMCSFLILSLRVTPHILRSPQSSTMSYANIVYSGTSFLTPLLLHQWV